MRDNYDLWEQHDYEQEKALEQYPICEHCGERITDESKHGREEGYVEMKTKEFVSMEDAYAYAFERCTNGTDEEIAEFKEMLVEWFYSGNWTKQEVCEE
jgi:hypothetical protein